MFLFPFLTAEHFCHVIIETTIVCICCISVFVFVPFWVMCGNTFMTKLHGIGVMLCELRLLAVLSFFVLCFDFFSNLLSNSGVFFIIKKNC